MSNSPGINEKETSERVIKNIETREEYKYLGRVMSFTDRLNKELRERREAAWKSFWSLKHIYKNKMISNKTKVEILEACTIPVLTYGAQTWALTETQLNKLRTTQRAMERSILNVKRVERIRNVEIRNRTKVEDAGFLVKKAKMSYAGRMMRTKKEKWNKRLYEWTPYGSTRKKGKPKTRWREEICNKLGVLWTRNTENKKVWKKNRGGLCPGVGGILAC